MRPHYVKFVRFSIDVPREGEVTIPFRVTVQADELPDEIGEVSEEIMVRVIHDPES